MKWVALSLLALAPSCVLADEPEALPRSRAETSGYEETSRYADVIAFGEALAKRSPLLLMTSFGKTNEGRALPLWILADPPIAHPREARSAGKPVVLIMANIHAGEVEGKEAAQHLARRILLGDLRPLLSRVVVLFAPIYNADGNEKISLENRTAQNGPIGGVGTRENAHGLDLNRDYMKLEAPETRALVHLLKEWDPLLTVDLHTTNGSYHGYDLTYSIPLNPMADPSLQAYHRETLMPAIGKAMHERHGYRTYYYGNFEGAADNRTWRAFTHQPRIGQNYVGLRNRFAILSEAYSYLDFRARVEVTEAFVADILAFVAAHGEAMQQVARRADRFMTESGLNGPPLRLGVAYEARALPEPVEILKGTVRKVKNPRSGHEMTAAVREQVTPLKMLDYGIFGVTRSVATPRAYLLPAGDETRAVVANLLAHGITVEELTEPLTAEADRFVVDEVRKAERPFQGHREIKLTGRYVSEKTTFPAGTIAIREAQPLAALASYLLEPESDDGLVTWNFFDTLVEPGKPFPVAKMMHKFSGSCRLLKAHE